MADDSITDKMVPSAQLLGLKFDLLTGDDIEKFSHVNINDASDLISSKLGVPNACSRCTTCGSTNIGDCEGHFGVIKLPTTIYHPYLIYEVVHILNQICPACKSIKMETKKDMKIKKTISSIRRLLLKMKFEKITMPQTRSILSRVANAHIKHLKFSGSEKEFKHVDILWDSQHKPVGQLFLKITMAESCPPRKFWLTLQSACLPIMDMIDWEQSRPYGVHDISDVFGIISSYSYFLGSLKSAVSDIGRNIHIEHLLLVADSLSVTGEFHGLSAKGIKQQRAHLSISSPFTQACFSNPEKCFIEAGMRGSSDHLYGTVDAVAWGKEASVGTGGPFKIIYSGKAPGADKWIGQSGVDNISVMSSSLCRILHKYPVNHQLNEADKSLLMEALMYHPKKDAKIGVGIKEIKIGHSPFHPNSRCFILIRKDGTTEDFSYRKCVIEAANQISPHFGLMVEKELDPRR